MELRHLRYFYTVALEMNFTKAAETLHIAQPPLSRQIKDLEDELGVRLFERRPHFMALTPEGELLKQYAAQILDLADKAAENVREIGQGLNGTINISTIEGKTLQFLSEWIASFSAEHPAVRYNIWTGGTDEIMTRIRNGLCDFAIAQDVRETAGICCDDLFHENWTAIIPKEYMVGNAGEEADVSSAAEDTGKITLPEEAGADAPILTEAHQRIDLTKDSIHVRDLCSHDLIVPMRTGREEEILSWFPEGSRPRIRCRFTHIMTAYELACQAMGIAVFPGTAPGFMDALDGNEVVLRKIDGLPSKPAFVLLYAEGRMQSNVVRHFMEHIRASAEDMIEEVG